MYWCINSDELKPGLIKLGDRTERLNREHNEDERYWVKILAVEELPRSV